MSVTTAWLVASALLLGAEMLTGTFYLLAIACGTALGALLAWLDAGSSLQLLAAAAGAALAVLLLQRWKARQPAAPAPQDDDIGQHVHIVRWLDGNHARVQYRGSEWNAELAAGESASPDASWQIAGRQGSVLLIRARAHTD
ncbi:NfeD family protein [Vogesella oryzae]|uniref:NfeD family protein n=1 Tax=Vogesella oryzae TaxID=1735285 RepID=UPI0015816D4A|nr:NfeD family protein [Vogesella oryzae]